MPITFGSPQALVAHQQDITTAKTTQDIAIIVCGGGDPFAEFALAIEAVERLGLPYKVYAGNDMIAHLPGHIDHAGTLHPEKIPRWMGERCTNGWGDAMPAKIWSHRPFTNVTNWTRDWAGSTGLFLVKVAREQGHTHIVLCGVPMTVTANHFLRKTNWDAAHGFRRGWTNQHEKIKRYVRSYSGWTYDLFGAPSDEWLLDVIDDHDPQQIPREGQKA